MPNLNALWLASALLAAVWLAHRGWRRLELSRAKHPSLTGHVKLTRRMAALLPFYAYDEREIFACDGAPEAIAVQRRAGFAALAASFRERAPQSIAFSDSLAGGLSDVQFTDNYRVPFHFRDYVREHLRVGSVVGPPSHRAVRSSMVIWAAPSKQRHLPALQRRAQDQTERR